VSTGREPELAFAILGPLEVRIQGQVVPPPAHKPSAVLALLLLHANETVSTDRLIDAVWGERPPARAKAALQVYVGQLRRALEPDREARSAGRVLVSEPAGYRLLVGDDALDRARFEALLAAGRDALAGGRDASAAAQLRAALELWRGPVLADFAYEPWARNEADRLEELRLVCLEERIEADLRLGHHGALVGELDALVRAHPLRERPRAQLMLALYRSGRQAEALDAYQRARRLLVDELGIDPSPELRELEAAILRQDEALAHGRVRPPTNLPSAPTRLVGREVELAEAAALLLRPDVRLLTLVGPGGIGKSRLGLALAERALPRFADGVFLCELAPIAKPAIALSSLARTLDVRETGSGSLLDEVKEAIGERSLALVVDNLEQVLELAVDLAELLASCPHLKLLATSRVPLRIRAERVYPVRPLATDEAVELFLDRARAVRPDFVPAAEVAEICMRLDGLPLAIELAAAHVTTLSARALLDQLERESRLTLLADGARDLPDRQRSLRATLHWSHGLLGEDERPAFARLSVFVGDFSSESAEAVADSSPATLRALVEKSLVALQPRPHSEWFRLLQTVREFAGEQLDERAETVGHRRRHAEHFAADAERLFWSYRSDVPEARERASAQLDDYCAAFWWAIENDRAELAHRLMFGLWLHFSSSGSLREGCDWASAVDSARGDVDPGERARGLWGASEMRRLAGDLVGAEAQARKALELAEAGGDERVCGTLLSTLARISLAQGDTTAARRVAEDALRLKQRHSNEAGVAGVQLILAEIELREGNAAAARALLLDCLPVWERQSSTSLMWTLARLAACARLDGERVNEAQEHLKRALALCAELENVAELPDIVVEVAAVRFVEDPERAAALLGYAEQAWDSMRHRGPRTVDPAGVAAELRVLLGEAALRKAIARGRTLDFAGAVGEARALVAR
jgi:predicted ATPase/DNA-binding SARP family transcriptional activator